MTFKQIQEWKKIGVILTPDRSTEGYSHTAVPFGEHINDDLFRLYYSSRDHNNKSFIRSVVINLSNFSILERSKENVLFASEDGYFDDAGCMGVSLLRVGSDDYLYYIGWNRSVTVPFRNALGVAVRKNGQTSFERLFRGPILDRSPFDPAFVASCCVLPHEKQFLMYYLSCDGWFKKNGKLDHRYNIKIATSTDAINWQRQGKIAIDYRDESEYAVSVPRIIRNEKNWQMWFSCRGNSYQIGYAESKDGLNWTRKDEQLTRFNQIRLDFETEMLCYPFVIRHRDRLIMLYNGNNYGATGIAAAILSSD
ncbi:MAG: hypothetical protein K2X27_27815 [Candidatus Obscuribacterales bacterium]|nr:hypothetical protein [Candidatus Obscuribacterales bacterium]